MPGAAHKQKELGRIIDIDILFYGDKVIEKDELHIPHPMIQKRAYTLVPLLEIAPEFMHPKLIKLLPSCMKNYPCQSLFICTVPAEEE